MEYEEIGDIKKILETGSLSLFIGSIVSIWHPSNIPSAQGLKNLIINSFLSMAKQSENIKVDFSSILKENHPRLEAVLEELFNCIGDKYIEYLFQLKQYKPNALHHFIAEGFKKRKIFRIYTTNQDFLLEESLRQLGWFPNRNYKIFVPGEGTYNDFLLPRIYKLHGCINKPESIRTIFRQIGKQLDSKLSNQLYQDLSRYPFLFIGYSGNDIDIRPILFKAYFDKAFWLDLPNKFAHNHISKQLQAKGKNVIPIEETCVIF